MDQQGNQEGKAKVTRSAARHLRRKKLIAARRETDRHLQSEDSSCNKQGVILIKNITNSIQNNCKCNSADNVKQENISTNESCDNRSSIGVTENNIKDISVNSSHSQMDSQEKTREQIKAEREAKKAAKAAAKAKGKVKDKEESTPVVQSNKVKVVAESQEKSKGNAETPSDKVTSDLSQSVKENITQNVGTEGKRKSDEGKKKSDEGKKKSDEGKKKSDEGKKKSDEGKKKSDEGKKKSDEGKKKSDDKPTDTEGDKSEDKVKAGEKSKAELRAERRAKQEAQRAAKQAALKPVEEKKKPVKSQPEKVQSKTVSPVNKEELVKKTVIKSEIKDNAHEVNLFKHLYINKKNISQLINSSNTKIHPAILRLGVQYAEKVIVGSNARCVALLAAIKQLIQDFERPSQADFSRGLESSLQESVNYLNSCRPSAVSMQNALKYLKYKMSALPATVPDEEAKFKLATAIDTYINEQILLAGKAISDAIQKKILNGDVILTYGFSSLICKILCDAYSAGKQFRVIIVDGRPWLEGKELLRRLVKHGIDCSYILINALSFIMPQVSKIFLGAHAILANGAVMARVGTAQVALIANAFNVPVLVACETHKSSERVQTDSIVCNEIGDPDQLVKSTFTGSKKSCLSNWKTRKTLNLLNLTYDVTPADLVTAVVTELAILPCTSVPVILRMKI